MAENKKDSGREDKDPNNTEPHDPVDAGQKAIAAEKIANDKGKDKGQQQKEEKEDAEKWRNEG